MADPIAVQQQMFRERIAAHNNGLWANADSQFIRECLSTFHFLATSPLVRWFGARSDQLSELPEQMQPT